MKKINFLSLFSVGALLCSCSTGDTPTENDTKAIVNEKTFENKFDNNAFTEALSAAWRDVNIDFTKLFDYSTREEANTKVKELISYLQQEIKWDLQECPGSDTMVLHFNLEEGTGRTQQIYFVSIKEDRVIKSVSNNGNNELREYKLDSSASKVMKSNALDWIAVDMENTNFSDYTQYEVIVDAESIRLFALNNL